MELKSKLDENTKGKIIVKKKKPTKVVTKKSMVQMNDSYNVCTASKTAFVSEDDVDFLIQRFPSMNKHFRILLKTLLSSYQNKQGNDGGQNNNNVNENDFDDDDDNSNDEDEEDFDGFY